MVQFDFISCCHRLQSINQFNDDLFNLSVKLRNFSYTASLTCPPRVERQAHSFLVIILYKTFVCSELGNIDIPHQKVLQTLDGLGSLPIQQVFSFLPRIFCWHSSQMLECRPQIWRLPNNAYKYFPLARILQGIPTQAFETLRQQFEMPQMGNKHPLYSKFVRPESQLYILLMASSIFVLGFLGCFDVLLMTLSICLFSLERNYHSCRCSSYCGKSRYERLKIVQETPQTVCFVAAEKAQQPFKSANFILCADQFSCGLKGKQHDKEDHRKHADRNPRHHSAFATGTLHLTPVSVETLPAQIVERDWHGGKAA